MNRTTIKTASCLALTLGLFAGAAAEVSVEGRVAADRATQVYAPIGGQIETIEAKVGQKLEPGDALMRLRTQKLYAQDDGVVRGIFGQPGDLVADVTARYGAVLYIEPEEVYTISASTESAYAATETKTIHVGETVYLRSANNKREGVGRVTKIAGTKFEAEVTAGGFIPGEKVALFRDAAFSRTQRLGQGAVERNAPIAVNGSALEGGEGRYSILSIPVEDGQMVRRGDPVLELLPGRFDGLYMSGEAIESPIAGTLATLEAAVGANIEKDAVVATLYTPEDMVIEAQIPEDSLRDFAEGDAVRIELLSDEAHRYEGVVRMISGVATVGEGETTFTAWIDFTPDAAVRFGSGVLVETIGKDE